MTARLHILRLPLIITLLWKQALHSISGIQGIHGGTGLLNPSFSRFIYFHTNWVATLRADGQWASEPFDSKAEQFGIGAVQQRQGLSRGRWLFGDTGWHVSAGATDSVFFRGNVSQTLPLTDRGVIVYGIMARLPDRSSGTAGQHGAVALGLGYSALGSHCRREFPFVPCP